MLPAIAALASVLQDTAAHRPRAAQSGTRDATRERLPTTQNHPNNFLAEASAMHGDSLFSPLSSRKRNAANAQLHGHSAHLRIQKAIADRALTARVAVIQPSGERRRKTRHALCRTATNFRQTIILPKLELCTGASTNTPA
jgi:hypothetical protein